MSFTTTLSYNDQAVTLVPGKMTFFPELYVDYKVEAKNNITRIQLMIHPKEKITLQGLKLAQKRSFQSQERIFCNGFQSWSESREYKLEERIPKLNFFAKNRMQYSGDAYFDFISRDKGQFHSWTYGYIRSGNKLDFIGSLNERTAFTILQYDTTQGLVSIEKECKGLALEHSFPILDIFIASGQETWVFNEYFNALECSPLKAPPLTGWTSSANYRTKISEEIILNNATAFTEKELPLDIIQINEGYQSKLGDWLKPAPTFPNGMAQLARQIKNKGFKVGIWLAPFICEAQSDIFKTKQHWLIKDSNDKPLRVGYQSKWGGWFYALNFYQKEVQDYLLSVFKILLEKWGYDLVKLDFLYAACIQAPANKTRGQMMNDVMEFLRSTVGDKWILACGVPLGSALGKVDYCQVGAGTSVQWEASFLKFLGHRERTSSISALRSVLGRWQLNGRTFHNEPGVISLSDSNSKLRPNQQYTILLINTLLGNLIFTSDFVGDYSEEQIAEFSTIYHWRNSTIKSVEKIDKDIYLIYFEKDRKDWLAACNLTSKSQKITIGKRSFELEAFESLSLAT